MKKMILLNNQLLFLSAEFLSKFILQVYWIKFPIKQVTK